MTSETSSALLYGLFPSINDICKSDPQTAKALTQAFVKVEKHAPGFSNDFLEQVHKRSNSIRPVQFNYDATLLALSCQKRPEFQLSLESELSPVIQNRADALKKILSSIPKVINDRPVFLQTIKDIAFSIRQLLDSLNQVLEQCQRTSRVSYDRLEFQKKEFVKFSKKFSDALKEYFQDRCQERQSGVFRAANRLLQQTNTVLHTLRRNQ